MREEVGESRQREYRKKNMPTLEPLREAKQAFFGLVLRRHARATDRKAAVS